MPSTKLPFKSPLAIEHLPPTAIHPNPRNARRHSQKQIAKLASAIRAHGFNVPIVIDDAGMILAGHARFEAALQLKLDPIPCIRLSHLTPAQKAAFAIADNKLGDLSDFDPDALRAQLSELVGIEFDLELTGFDTAEIDLLLDDAPAASDPADTFDEPDPDQPAVTRTGDLWVLDRHRLTCGDALEAGSYERVLAGELAQMAFTDVPYNVPVQGHVSGLGKVRHREFAMASGEMSEAQFREFLAKAMAQMVRHSADGSIHFHCIDWRHVHSLIEAANGAYDELKNICVWAKINAGMGSLYRSQHEFVVVFKKGRAPHINNVELGKNGRYRTNVWTYAGANSFSRTRDADLAAHPTVKPVGLVADAIRDCSKRGGLVLDPFSGSGTTILACQRTGRRAAAIELDPLYVDTAVRRWQALTGLAARLGADGPTFEEVRAELLGDDADVGEAA